MTGISVWPLCSVINNNAIECKLQALLCLSVSIYNNRGITSTRSSDYYNVLLQSNNDDKLNWQYSINFRE